MKESILKTLQQQNDLTEISMYLYGASGHCKVIIDIITASEEFKIEGIMDDNPKITALFDIPVFNTSTFDTLADKSFIIAVGNNKIRKKIVEKVGDIYITAIHPRSVISPYTVIDAGTVVMAGVIVNADAVIGKHCIINTAAVIEHDCILGDYVHVSPNAALGGAVEVGEGAHIGIGATVIQGIKIGKWATIGAGTVIINDIPDYAVVVGNPGKILKYHTKHE